MNQAVHILANKVVTQTGAGERAIYRTVGRGDSFGASPLRQEIGLGQSRAIIRIEIFWPATGKTQTMRGLAMDRCYAIREGDSAAREIVLRSFAWPAATGVPNLNTP
jgi:ASPIC and UnbV